jgi:hypothetical protein
MGRKGSRSHHRRLRHEGDKNGSEGDRCQGDDHTDRYSTDEHALAFPVIEVAGVLTYGTCRHRDVPSRHMMSPQTRSAMPLSMKEP